MGNNFATGSGDHDQDTIRRYIACKSFPPAPAPEVANIGTIPLVPPFGDLATLKARAQEQQQQGSNNEDEQGEPSPYSLDPDADLPPIPNGCLALVANDGISVFLVSLRSAAKVSQFLQQLLEVSEESLASLDNPPGSSSSSSSSGKCQTIEEDADDNREQCDRMFPLSGARADALSVQLFASWAQLYYPHEAVTNFVLSSSSASTEIKKCLTTKSRKPFEVEFPVSIPESGNPDFLFLPSDPAAAAFIRQHACPDYNMLSHTRRVYNLALFASYLQIPLLMRQCVAFLTFMIRLWVRETGKPHACIKAWFGSGTEEAATKKKTKEKDPEQVYTEEELNEMESWMEETVTTMRVPNYIKLRDEREVARAKAEEEGGA